MTHQSISVGFFLAILTTCLFLASPTLAELPVEVRRDQYILGLSKALKSEDYPKALEFIDELESLGGELPPSVDYFRGEAYFHTQRFGRSHSGIDAIS